MVKEQEKKIRQVRNAVRRKPLHQVLAFLNVVPSVERGCSPSTSRQPFAKEQQVRYCISEGNLCTMQRRAYDSLSDLSRAYEMLVEDVETRAQKCEQWQGLSQRERSSVLSEVYRRASAESSYYGTSDREYYTEQKRIGNRESDLEHGSTEPQYDLRNLRRLRAGIKYWQGLDAQGLDSLNETLAKRLDKINVILEKEEMKGGNE